jgi:DNA processing protein
MLTRQPISYEDRLALLRLARTKNVGPISFFHLIKRYGCAQEALNRLPDIMRRSALKIPSLDDAKREIESHEKQNFLLVSYYDKEYPLSLKILKDAPAFLSMRGKTDLFHRPLFAMVGARNASQAGQFIAKQIAEQLSKHNWVLISGLARGIDACVHQATLESGTIAVVVGGMGNIYPPEHKKLYYEIAEKGLIMSEDPLGQEPQAALFPKRNRLISGLSWGVLIVEANLKSGSLTTAKYAADQGRIVFAVPGHPLDIRSKGVNKLIKQGACLVESADDILSEYIMSHHHVAEAPQDTYEPMARMDENRDEIYKKLAQALTIVPTSIGELASSLSFSPVSLRGVLIEMELNGEIEWYPGDCVMRISSNHGIF